MPPPLHLPRLRGRSPCSLSAAGGGPNSSTVLYHPGPSLLRLLRSVIGDAADHGAPAEFLAQTVHRTFGVGGAAVEHIEGVVISRARPQRADAGAHQAERGAVDLLRQHLAADRKDPCRQLRWSCDRLRARAPPEI